MTLVTTPRTDGAAAFTDGEAQRLFHRDGLDQLHRHGDVVARHHHLPTLRQLDHAGHVGGAEVELRAIAIEEGLVPAPFRLAQHVHLGLELGVRGDGARLRQHLAALHVLAVDAAQQHARRCRPPGPDPGSCGTSPRPVATVLRVGCMPDDLDFVAGLHHAPLDPARRHRAAAGDGEHVLDRHQEGQIHRAGRGRDVLVHRIHQLPDLPAPLAVTLRAAALQRLHRGARR